jgi:hypothetical protein
MLRLIWFWFSDAAKPEIILLNSAGTERLNTSMHLEYNLTKVNFEDAVLHLAKRNIYFGERKNCDAIQSSISSTDSMPFGRLPDYFGSGNFLLSLLFNKEKYRVLKMWPKSYQAQNHFRECEIYSLSFLLSRTNPLLTFQLIRKACFWSTRLLSLHRKQLLKNLLWLYFNLILGYTFFNVPVMFN